MLQHNLSATFSVELRQKIQASFSVTKDLLSPAYWTGSSVVTWFFI